MGRVLPGEESHGGVHAGVKKMLLTRMLTHGPLLLGVRLR